MCQKSKMSLFTYEKLYWAYLDCRKIKRKTINALDFEIDFENNLRELLCELKTRKYRPGRSIFLPLTSRASGKYLLPIFATELSITCLLVNSCRFSKRGSLPILTLAVRVKGRTGRSGVSAGI
jgi:hypothetical protein